MLCAYPLEIEGVLNGIAHLAAPADVRHEDVDDSRVIIIFGLHGSGLVIALIEIHYDIAAAHGRAGGSAPGRTRPQCPTLPG